MHFPYRFYLVSLRNWKVFLVHLVYCLLSYLKTFRFDDASREGVEKATTAKLEKDALKWFTTRRCFFLFCLFTSTLIRLGRFEGGRRKGFRDRNQRGQSLSSVQIGKDFLFPFPNNLQSDINLSPPLSFRHLIVFGKPRGWADNAIRRKQSKEKLLGWGQHESLLFVSYFGKQINFSLRGWGLSHGDLVKIEKLMRRLRSEEDAMLKWYVPEWISSSLTATQRWLLRVVFFCFSVFVVHVMSLVALYIHKKIYKYKFRYSSTPINPIHSCFKLKKINS